MYICNHLGFWETALYGLMFLLGLYMVLPAVPEKSAII